ELVGVLCDISSLHSPGLLHLDSKLGAAGLTSSAGLAGWLEFVLLRRSLNKRIGNTGLPGAYSAKLWLGAIIGAAVGWGLKLLVAGWHPIPLAIVVLGGYGVTYFGIEYLFGVQQSQIIILVTHKVARI